MIRGTDPRRPRVTVEGPGSTEKPGGSRVRNRDGSVEWRGSTPRYVLRVYSSWRRYSLQGRSRSGPGPAGNSTLGQVGGIDPSSPTVFLGVDPSWSRPPHVPSAYGSGTLGVRTDPGTSRIRHPNDHKFVHIPFDPTSDLKPVETETEGSGPWRVRRGSRGTRVRPGRVRSLGVSGRTERAPVEASV